MVEVEIYSSCAEKRPVKVNAIIDTGAQISCIPEKILKGMGIKDYSYEAVRFFSGKQEIKSYFINLSFGNINIQNTKVLAIDSDYGLLGRDILNQMAIFIDGPNKLIKLWPGNNK